MPISDLLASITGEKPKNSAPVPSAPATGPKRRADNDLNGPAAKTPRTTATANGAGRPNGSQSSYTSRLSDRPLAPSSADSKSISVPRPADKIGGLARGNSTQGTPSKPVSSTSVPNGSRPTPGGPTAQSRVTANAGPKTEPKKKSFAEIMARAKAAQDALAHTKLGTIQHKTIEKGTTKRERVEAKALEARQAAKLARQNGARREGSGQSSRRVNGSGGVGKTAGGNKAAPVAEKKVKKAALATTGYTGTARPRPGASSTKANGLLSAPGTGARARERPRFGGALSGSRRHYEDEDEDLDDFIEYDDDEEEPGYGVGASHYGGYESMEEDESDMEAGMTDVEEEERRAQAIALREDREQQALEAKLKREKEEKKRRLMESARQRG